MKKYDYLRPAKNIVFAIKFFDGANYSYQISGAPVCFGTKKAAAKYIRENFTGEAAAVRLYDLRHYARTRRR